MFVPDPLEPGRYGADSEDPVRIAQRRDTLVLLLARRGQAAALAEAVAIALPPPGAAAVAGAVRALWTRPDGWLLQAPADHHDELLARLERDCAGHAAIVDQSHGHVVFTLAGSGASDVLARLCRLDLHPRAFAAGRVAVTPLGGLAAVLHQTEALPGYEMIIASSYARAFGRILARAAAPLGYQVM